MPAETIIPRRSFEFPDASLIEAHAMQEAKRRWNEIPEFYHVRAGRKFEDFYAAALEAEKRLYAEKLERAKADRGYYLTQSEADEIAQLRGGFYSITQSGNRAYNDAWNRAQAIADAARHRGPATIQQAAE